MVNIAHQVLCSICNTSFDRDKIAYTKTSSRRYAHADCALRRAAQLNQEITFEIIDPNDFVKCKFCKQEFQKSKTEYVQIGNSQYAHSHCTEIEEKREKTDEEKLYIYIMKLFGYNYVPPRAKKQINQFVQEYNYTYSGMQKALEYYYEISGMGDLDQAHDGVGIIPYVYQKAYDYYYNLWLAKQKNEYKTISHFIPQTIEVRITTPKRNIQKRNLFSFLDEEAENVE